MMLGDSSRSKSDDRVIYPWSSPDDFKKYIDNGNFSKYRFEGLSYCLYDNCAFFGKSYECDVDVIVDDVNDRIHYHHIEMCRGCGKDRKQVTVFIKIMYLSRIAYNEWKNNGRLPCMSGSPKYF